MSHAPQIYATTKSVKVRIDLADPEDRNRYEALRAGFPGRLEIEDLDGRYLDVTVRPGGALDLLDGKR